MHLLDFNLNYPSVNVFLKRYKDIFSLSKAHRTLSKKYSILSLLEYSLSVGRLPSLVAAGIIYLCLKPFLQEYYLNEEELHRDMERKTGHSMQEIQPVAQQIFYIKGESKSSLVVGL